MACSFQRNTACTSRIHCIFADHRCFFHSYDVLLLYLIFLDHPRHKWDKIHQLLCEVPCVFLSNRMSSDRKVIAVGDSVKPASTSNKLLISTVSHRGVDFVSLNSAASPEFFVDSKFDR